MVEFFHVKPVAHRGLRSCVIISLAYCYYARLPRAERVIFVDVICGRWQELQTVQSRCAPDHGTKCRFLKLDPDGFLDVLTVRSLEDGRII